MSNSCQGLSLFAAFTKRTFDLFFALGGLIFLWWIILIAALLSWLDTGKNGFFTQNRVGRDGHIFKMIKIRTMHDGFTTTTVTTSNDPRITKLGHFFRKFKIDELPQLINIIVGSMSFVGPRPDVPGFADKLEGEDRIILSIRPGITSPATLKFRNEETILARQKDPELYNATVIFPEKIRLNKEYIKNYSFFQDIQIILKTIFKI
jgi:lipopolysaccharide/colanic/teichoic acid biosynthesis glycosyltransferase